MKFVSCLPFLFTIGYCALVIPEIPLGYWAETTFREWNNGCSNPAAISIYPLDHCEPRTSNTWRLATFSNNTLYVANCNSTDCTNCIVSTPALDICIPPSITTVNRLPFDPIESSVIYINGFNDPCRNTTSENTRNINVQPPFCIPDTFDPPYYTQSYCNASGIVVLENCNPDCSTCEHQHIFGMGSCANSGTTTTRAYCLIDPSRTPVVSSTTPKAETSPNSMTNSAIKLSMQTILTALTCASLLV